MPEITMPRLSDTMEEGTIASWLKKPGDQVSKGDVLAQIETDKATMDLTAFEAGTLQEILAPEGTTVPIGQPVARIGQGAAPAKQEPTSEPPGAEATGSERPKTEQARENVTEAPEPTTSSERQSTRPAPAAEPSTSSGEGQSTTPAPAAEPSTSMEREAARKPTGPAPADRQATAPAPAPGHSETDGAAAPSDGGKVRASPMARHIAAEHGIDLAGIQGSGPLGRVVRADVEAAVASGQQQAPAAAAAPPPGEDDERVQLSQMRRTIARRMAESTRTVPHFFLTVVVDATELSGLRRQLVEQLESEGIKPSINDLLVKASAMALRKVPDVNVSFAEDALIRHHRVHVGIAVATERGLIVPVLRDVDRKTISQIAIEAKDLATRAQTGKLQPNEYTGGTFTVSNLGMFGVEQFNAVINPPEAAILAVGAITREPAEYQAQIVLRERMRLTLSVDHRATDGATGAKYLQELKKLLEKPLLLLV
jgi:pyruvate dehydrogenase E2 component (dihydrolipoamide acetyltransferase)